MTHTPAHTTDWTLYHGASEFKKGHPFSLNHLGKHDSAQGVGIYFTDDIFLAQRYAKPDIYAVHLQRESLRKLPLTHTLSIGEFSTWVRNLQSYIYAKDNERNVWEDFASYNPENPDVSIDAVLDEMINLYIPSQTPTHELLDTIANEPYSDSRSAIVSFTQCFPFDYYCPSDNTVIFLNPRVLQDAVCCDLSYYRIKPSTLDNALYVAINQLKPEQKQQVLTSIYDKLHTIRTTYQNDRNSGHVDATTDIQMLRFFAIYEDAVQTYLETPYNKLPKRFQNITCTKPKHLPSYIENVHDRLVQNSTTALHLLGHAEQKDRQTLCQQITAACRYIQSTLE